MATDEEKKMNAFKLTGMILHSLTLEVWDTLGESASAMGKGIGEEILAAMEKETGLEIAGETPKEFATEAARIFVDEYGFAKEITVEMESEDKIIIKVKGCLALAHDDSLRAAGVSKIYTCPIMNACTSGLRDLGYKARGTIERWDEGKGSIITFTRI
jgi:hypothetical protein